MSSQNDRLQYFRSRKTRPRTISNLETISPKKKPDLSLDLATEPAIERLALPFITTHSSFGHSLTSRSSSRQKPETSQTAVSSARQNIDSLSEQNPFQAKQLRSSIDSFRKLLNQDLSSMSYSHVGNTNKVTEKIAATIIQECESQNSLETPGNKSNVLASDWEEDLRKLFFQLLSNKFKTWTQKMEYVSIYAKMETLYISKNSSHIFKKAQYITDTGHDCLSHCFSLWLKNMGYGKEETRRRVLRNMINFMGVSVDSEVLSEIYNSLFLGYLPQNLRILFLMELCRRGWQYFVFFSVRYLIYIKGPNKETEISWHEIQTMIKQ